jgi:hypothetical protein
LLPDLRVSTANCPPGRCTGMKEREGQHQGEEHLGSLGLLRGDGRVDAGIHCLATLTLRVREIISAMVSDCGPMK